MISIEDIAEAFPEARIVATVSQAADADGYDGGWIARDEHREAWGATPEEAKRNLSEMNKQPIDLWQDHTTQHHQSNRNRLGSAA